MEEIFVTCQFNTRLLIGNYGTVKRTDPRTIARFGEICKGSLRPDGYKMYFISKWYYAHQLVAIHFIPNPNNWKEINHIDGVKNNNYQGNLEWSTRSLNIKHRFDVLGQTVPGGKDHWLYGTKASDETRQLMSNKKKGDKHPRFTGYYCYNGIKYSSSYEAEQATGICYKTIIRRAKNNKKGWSFELSQKHLTN